MLKIASIVLLHVILEIRKRRDIYEFEVYTRLRSIQSETTEGPINKLYCYWYSTWVDLNDFG